MIILTQNNKNVNRKEVIFMTLGKKIRCLRREIGMTQSELAKTSKLSQGYISLIEKEAYIPRDSTLIALSFALKIPSEELLNFENSKIAREERKIS